MFECFEHTAIFCRIFFKEKCQRAKEGCTVAYPFKEKDRKAQESVATNCAAAV